MFDSPYERFPAYDHEGDSSFFTPGNPFERWKYDSGNQHYRTTVFTWLSLLVLVIFYPAMSLLGGDSESVSEMLKNMTPGLLVFTLVTTIVVQWAIFGLNWAAVYSEHTGLRGLGLGKLTPLHLAWAVAFWLAAIVILGAIGWVMAQYGLEIPGEIGLLIPESLGGKLLWVLVSITAGFCEEVAFRGYLMTRFRLLFRSQSWLLPTILSSVIFGICHTYQGIAGFIMITIYGVLFSLLYIRTKSLWPGIIAHFFQDVMYIFIPGDFR